MLANRGERGVERRQLVGPLRLFPGVFDLIEDVLVILAGLHAGRGDNDLRMRNRSGCDRDRCAYEECFVHIPFWLRVHS